MNVFCFSDMFVGSAHSMSCVLKRSWLVRIWSWLQPELRLARHIGLSWLEVTWPEVQPEFAGLGLAVWCVEAGYGCCRGPLPK